MIHPKRYRSVTLPSPVYLALSSQLSCLDTSLRRNYHINTRHCTRSLRTGDEPDDDDDVMVTWTP